MQPRDSHNGIDPGARRHGRDPAEAVVGGVPIVEMLELHDRKLEKQST